MNKYFFYLDILSHSRSFISFLFFFLNQHNMIQNKRKMQQLQKKSMLCLHYEMIDNVYKCQTLADGQTK